MPACEGFIRACRWNVQGHRQYSLLSVLILPSSSVTSYTPPPSLCLQYPPAPSDEPVRPQKEHGQRHTAQFLVKLHKHYTSKIVYEACILYFAFDYDAG